MTLGAIPEARMPREDELEREEKFTHERTVLVALDHGPNSQRAFAWALDNFLTQIDSVHLLHVLPKPSDGVPCTSPHVTGDHPFSPMYEATQLLFDTLSREAHDKGIVKVISVIKDGDAGKEICAEATRTKPVAVIMGSRGLSVMKRVLVGSATEYCVRHSPVPLVIVPHNYNAGAAA